MILNAPLVLHNSKTFSLITDEVTDRYFNPRNYCIFFVCSRYVNLFNKAPLNQKIFVDPVRVQGKSTGKLIENHVLDILQRYEIDLKHCRGHVFDRASAMASKYKGASVNINEAYFALCGNQC